jgi:chromosome transmission fidelity protein 1
MDDDWNSDEEGMSRRRAADRGAAGSDSDTPAGGGGQEEQDEYEPLQVVFCSRTHSQLAQVIGELCRTRFAGRFRAVVLAGRAVLCVNDAVRAPAARLNDACRDLQKKGKAKASKAAKGATSAAADAPGASKGAAKHRGCPFLASRGPAVAALREAVLEKPMDVEDMTSAGRAGEACPYYAARGAVPAAHIIFLPYAALVNQDMRCAHPICVAHPRAPDAATLSCDCVQRGAGLAAGGCSHRGGRGTQPARGCG